MLFLNGTNRNRSVAPMMSHGILNANTLTHTWYICGSLSLVIGLILIVLSLIYDVKATRYAGIGFIGFGTAIFISKLIYQYGHLDRCYNNWAYGGHVAPIHHNPTVAKLETIVPIPPRVESPDLTQKHGFQIGAELPTCKTMVSSIEILKNMNTVPVNHNTITDDPINTA